jgi:hypothetical protein
MERDANLMEVVAACDSTGTFPGRLHRRQQKRHKNADDRNNDEQFNQRESTASLFFTEPRRSLHSHILSLLKTTNAMHAKSAHVTGSSPILRRRTALHLGVTGLHVREVRLDFIFGGFRAEDEVLTEKAADGNRGSCPHQGICILDQRYQCRHAFPVEDMSDALGSMGTNCRIVMAEPRPESLPCIRVAITASMGNDRLVDLIEIDGNANPLNLSAAASPGQTDKKQKPVRAHAP